MTELTTQARLEGADDVAKIEDYARRVYRRADGIDEVVPPDFVPAWDDRPGMFANYGRSGALKLLGPDGIETRYSRARSLARGVPAALDFAGLSTLLYLVAAPLRRKLELSWNSKEPLIGFTQQEYRRGTASGGGLYPTQIYIVSGGAPVPAGVYRYDPGHHRLIPLRRGDHRLDLACATGSDGSSLRGLSLVLTCDVWQNCFKYSNFSYHVCTQDVGAMLVTIRLVLDSFGIDKQVRIRFADSEVSDLLGLRSEQEVPLAIVTIGSDDAPSEAANARSDSLQPEVVRPEQRSRNPSVPQAIIELHEAGMLGAADVNATTSTIGVARPEALDQRIFDALPQVLLKRRSAWNSMDSGAPASADEIGKLLSFMVRHGSAAQSIGDDKVLAGTVELALQSNHIADLAPGGYRWAENDGRFEPVAHAAPEAWQSTYAMLNYNLDQAAGLIFVTGALEPMLAAHGARGYRVLNARIGMMAQLAYVGAAALSLACGVVLGARAQMVKKLLGLPPERDVMLAIYVGGAVTPAELFDFNFLRQGTP